MSRVLLIDNYDSFTYNLVQALRILGAEVHVRTNDSIGLDQAHELDPTHLVVSPGPGRPEAAGEDRRLPNGSHGGRAAGGGSTEIPRVGALVGAAHRVVRRRTT